MSIGTTLRWWRCTRCWRTELSLDSLRGLGGNETRGAGACRPIKLAAGQTHVNRKITMKRAAPEDDDLFCWSGGVDSVSRGGRKWPQPQRVG